MDREYGARLPINGLMRGMRFMERFMKTFLDSVLAGEAQREDIFVYNVGSKDVVKQDLIII